MAGQNSRLEDRPENYRNEAKKNNEGRIKLSGT